MGKCSSFDVSGVIIENSINKEITKEDPPPLIEEYIIEDKEESEQEEDKQKTSP